jgi:feruloyl esterase
VAAPGWRQWKLGTSTTATPNSAFTLLMQDALAHEFFTPFTPAFSLFDFDFDRDPARMDAESNLYDTYRDDRLTAFQRHGGKLMFVHGLADPIFSPLDTMDYYNRLAANNGGVAAVKNWARAFFVPGMTHCAGGPATDVFDGLAAIIDWVENGHAPDRMIAAGKSFPGRTRPLCAYPTQAHYSGRGSIEDAANFVCR